MSYQCKEEQAWPVAMFGGEWSMECIHETNVLCVLCPFHDLPFGAARKPLSKEEQCGEQYTASEDYSSSNKSRDVTWRKVLNIGIVQPNNLIELSGQSRDVNCNAAMISRSSLE